MEKRMLLIDEVETPLGAAHLAASGDGLCWLGFAPFDPRARFGEVELRRQPLESALRVRAFFQGDLRALDELKLDPGGTPFQRAVWSLLRKIPAGATRTYGQLARELGSAARAVGSANARNPVCLAIPCHRVVAAGGALCGYAWGEERKRWLLRHEAARPSTAASEVRPLSAALPSARAAAAGG